MVNTSPIPSVRPYKTGLVDKKYVSATQAEAAANKPTIVTKDGNKTALGVSNINVPVFPQMTPPPAGTPTPTGAQTMSGSSMAGSNITQTNPQAPNTPLASMPVFTGTIEEQQKQLAAYLAQAQANIDQNQKDYAMEVNNAVGVEQGFQTEAEKNKSDLEKQLAEQASGFTKQQEDAYAARIAGINSEFDIAKQSLLAQHDQQRELLLDRIGAAGGGNLGSKALEEVSKLEQSQTREQAQLEALRAKEMALAQSEKFGATVEFQQSQRTQIAAAQEALTKAKQEVARNIIELRKGLTASNRATYEKILSGLQARAQSLQDQQNALDLAKQADDRSSIKGRREAATKQVQAITNELVTNGLTLDPTASKDVLAAIQTSTNPEELAQNYIQQASRVPAVKALFAPKAKGGGSGSGGAGGSKALMEWYARYADQPDRQSALKDLERNKAIIIGEVGASGYDKVWEEVNRQFPDYTKTSTTSKSSLVIPNSPIEQHIATLRKVPGFTDADIRATLGGKYPKSEIINSSAGGGVIDKISAYLFK